MNLICASLFTLGLLASSATLSFAQPATLNLSPASKAAIGKKVWQNECGGTVNGLTTWNVGEEFPSLGIGHFIWYPAGFNGRFNETWPQFIEFAQKHGAKPPSVALLADCPWSSKQEFQADFNGPRLTALRTWLANNVSLQTDFIISRSRAALPKILAAAPAKDRARIEANYHNVATTPQGVYALMDYVNFKGDGTNPKESYGDVRWGLLQVLQGMRPTSSGPAAAAEFAASAKRCLNRRIDASPKARGEARWREGWNNRCNTYAKPL